MSKDKAKDPSATEIPSGKGSVDPSKGKVSEDELDQVVGGLNPCPLPPRSLDDDLSP